MRFKSCSYRLLLKVRPGLPEVGDMTLRNPAFATAFLDTAI